MGIVEILDRIFFFLMVHTGPWGIIALVVAVAVIFVLPWKEITKELKLWRNSFRRATVRRERLSIILKGDQR